MLFRMPSRLLGAQREDELLPLAHLQPRLGQLAGELRRVTLLQARKRGGVGESGRLEGGVLVA